MKDYRLYILIRTDIDSMKSGRAAAQASHATSAFMKSFGPDGKCPRQEVKDWMKQSKQGFGTAIVLGVTEEQINDLFNKSLKRWVMKEKVYDPDYVIRVNLEIFGLLVQNYSNNCDYKFVTDKSEDGSILVSRNEMTCAYIFGDKEDLVENLGKLPLYS